MKPSSATLASPFGAFRKDRPKGDLQAGSDVADRSHTVLRIYRDTPHI